MGEFIYIIGCLGYPDARVSGETPVYRLHCDSLYIEKVETSEEKPVWLSRHKARWILMDSGAGKIQGSGGKSCRLLEEEQYLDNTNAYVLDLVTMSWRRLEAK